MKAKVIFYRVKDNSAKIQWICAKAEDAIKQEQRLLITVPNFQAAQYIDSLLWKSPPESFIPHVVSDTQTSEWIAITLQNQVNVNEAAFLFNLCPSPHPECRFKEIYELFDVTDPQKAHLSEQKLLYYQNQGFTIIHISY